MKITRLEFFEEATRLRDNLIGFKQVFDSLANNTEKKKSCNDTATLISEWNEDTKKLKENYQSYIDNDTVAKEYFESVQKLNDSIASDCNSL